MNDRFFWHRRRPYLKTMTIVLAVFLQACSSLGVQSHFPELNDDRGRLLFAPANRSPLTSKIPFVGRFSRITSDAGRVVYADADYSFKPTPISYIDLKPGMYSLLAQCERLPSFRGARSIWMVDTTVQVQSGKTTVVLCRNVMDESSKSARVEIVTQSID